MRVFAWSDLHLEVKSNFEVVRDFCALHYKHRTTVPPGFNEVEQDAPDTSFKRNVSIDYRHPGSTASGHAPGIPEDAAWSHFRISLATGVGKLWETIRGQSTTLNEDFSQDVLILAGDIHTDLEGLKESLQLFCSVFRHVAFVPGNHELWVTQKDREAGIGDSIQKLDSILLLCESLGVHTKPFCPSADVRVVPLLSWYDEFDPQFCSAAQPATQPAQERLSSEKPYLGSMTQSIAKRNTQKDLEVFSENWMDYCACKWPHPLSNNDPRPGSDHGTQYWGHEQSDYEALLFKRPAAGSQTDQRACVAANPSSASASSTTALIRMGGEDAGAVAGARRLCGSSLKPNCSALSARKACPSGADCAPRQTRDLMGMPLNLADFFACENERRGCFIDICKEPRGVSQSQQHELRAATALPVKAPHKSDSEESSEPRESHSYHINMNEGQQSSTACTYASSFVKNPHSRFAGGNDGKPVVITFSHFLPRAELTTIHPLTPRALAYVMGSTRIDEQLRQAGGSIHVFGHSHVNADEVIEGVRYIQHSLGRPSEQRWFPGRRVPKVILEI